MSTETRHSWFETAVSEALPRLYATALRMTRNEADAEDLVADTLVRAWNAIDTLQDRGAFRGWVCRILTNTFISQQRAAGAKVDTEPYLEACEDGDEGSFSLFERLHQPFLLWQGNPEKLFLDRLLREDIEGAIDTLPEAFRLVVLLVEVQGMTYQEVADALEVPIGTVRSRLARGRSMLQEQLWNQARDAGLGPDPRSGPTPTGHAGGDAAR